MRRLFTFILLISLIAALPIAAQDTCTLDISAALDALVDAQTAAAQGDSDAAQDALAVAQSELDALISACGDAPVENPDDVPVISAPEDVVLEASYTANDGQYRFNYPEDWELDSGSMSSPAGDSYESINLTEPDIERETSSDLIRTISLIVCDPFTVARWGGADTSTIEYPLEGGLDTLAALFEAPNADIPINVLGVRHVLFEGMPALEVNYQIEDQSDDTEMDARLYVIEYEADEVYLLIGLIAESDVVDEYQLVAQAIAASVTFEE